MCFKTIFFLIKYSLKMFLYLLMQDSKLQSKMCINKLILNEFVVILNNHINIFFNQKQNKFSCCAISLSQLRITWKNYI